MKILILTDNYPPEMNANARIISELAKYWQLEAETISVITSHPNFPRGKLFENHKNKWVLRKKENNINIIRLKTYIYKNDGFLRRSLDFLSFGLNAFIYGLFKKKDDVIVGITPQFFCALSACLIAQIKRKNFILILCDLWPDSILYTGNLKQGFLFNVLKKIENYIYKKAILIATLSPDYNNYLIKNGVNNKKIFTSISGVDKQFYPREKNKFIMEHYNLHNKFVVAYIGNLGVAQNHEDILDIAYIFQKNNESFHFIIIGDGVKREKLIQSCKAMQLRNVTIDGPFLSEMIPEYWSVSDIALITLADIKTNETVIPSKMLESMAMAKPLVLYAPKGEAKKFLEQSGSGIFVEIGHKPLLQKTFEQLKNDKSLMDSFGEKAYLFSKQYRRENQAYSLLKEIRKTLWLSPLRTK